MTNLSFIPFTDFKLKFKILILVFLNSDLNLKMQNFNITVTYFDYHILSSIMCPFYEENDAEIFSAHYAWKVAEKGFKMVSVMND
jgi:hypothetical protein